MTQVHLSSTIGWLLLIDCYLVAALLLSAAAIIGVYALRNLAGGIKIDDHGLELSPFFFRQAIAWQAIQEWDARQIAQLRLLRIQYGRDQRSENLILTSQCLSLEHLRQIERELRRRGF